MDILHVNGPVYTVNLRKYVNGNYISIYDWLIDSQLAKATTFHKLQVRISWMILLATVGNSYGFDDGSGPAIPTIVLL